MVSQRIMKNLIKVDKHSRFQDYYASAIIAEQFKTRSSLMKYGGGTHDETFVELGEWENSSRTDRAGLRGRSAGRNGTIVSFGLLESISLNESHLWKIRV